MKNIVVIGGGTGTYTVLSGIKKIPDINITAIVSSADSGGSTGILRDEFGQLPVGDFRQCIVALAPEVDGQRNLVRELFQYRFAKGGAGLSGHNFGNLFITVLTDILGDEELAFRKVSRVLNIKGRVFPVTFDKVQLVAEYTDGSILYGEASIDEPPAHHNGKVKIKRLWVQPKAEMYEGSRKAIAEADLIILGPGDLYTSTIANFVTDGCGNEIKKSKAKILYIPNLVSKYGQTHNFKTSDYISEIEKYLKCRVDYILINNSDLPTQALKLYAQEKAFPVEDDISGDDRTVHADLLLNTVFERESQDKVARSLLRHDSGKIAEQVEKLLNKF